MKALSFKKEGVVSFFLELRKEAASGCEEKGENRRHKRLASRGKEGLSGSKKRRGVGEYFFRLGGFLFKERRQRKVVFFWWLIESKRKGFGWSLWLPSETPFCICLVCSLISSHLHEVVHSCLYHYLLLSMKWKIFWLKNQCYKLVISIFLCILSLYCPKNLRVNMLGCLF